MFSFPLYKDFFPALHLRRRETEEKCLIFFSHGSGRMRIFFAHGRKEWKMIDLRQNHPLIRPHWVDMNQVEGDRNSKVLQRCLV